MKVNLNNFNYKCSYCEEFTSEFAGVVLSHEKICDHAPKHLKETFEFQAESKNFGYQVLAFKNDYLDIIIRNNDKKTKTKYKVTIEVINNEND